MCGIAGFYGPYGEAELAAMTRMLAHRGPDGEGLEIRRGVSEPDRVGLGHRRLSIIDLSGGRQPMWSTDGSVGIVFNGEIYNYRDLRRELANEGAQFRTASDTEVIIEGWRLRGPRILPALAGMFAFGLWDNRTRRWIFARDRAGIKPLHYATPHPGALAFASEIKPLLPLLPRVAPNLGAIYDFLLYSWTPGPETVFTGVRHLPPGHWLSWAAGDGEPKPVSFATRRFTRSTLDTRAAAHELRDAFDRAVESHLVADVPVGIALSGGLDSSAVLASMARVHPPRSIDAFTVGFGLADDETPYARQMAEHVGVRHHVRTVPRDRVAQDFAGIVRTIEEPIAHPVLQTTFEMARFVREHVKVALIGEGSDELFLGYPQYRLLTPPFRYAPRHTIQRFYLAMSCLMPTPKEISGMLQPSVFDRERLDASAHRFDHYFLEGDVVNGSQAFEFDNPMVANQLMRIDKLTMAHSIEARVPFLDNDFVDFAFSLPVSFRLGGGVTKAVLREAMAERLPPAILRRPKTGKGGTQALLPYLNGLLVDGPLADLVSRKAIERRGWLDPDRVFSYLAAGRSTFVRHNPIESRRRAKFVYALAVLEQWAREYLDKGPA
jgi:asparagine synthase (glutamine-hydrolysing)